MTFDNKINIIYGDNAQGKTNILEALYVCATSKSHRTSKDKDIIRFGNDEAHIKVIVKKHDMNYRIDMHLKKNKTKGIAVNAIPIKRAVELFGIINIVIFSPEDLNIIKNGPSERRRFVDMELSQLDKIYLSNLINYNKVVVQRNKLLKQLQFTNDKQLIDMLDVWDLQLVKYGTEIIKRRNQFIKDINLIIQPVHNKLSGGKEVKKYFGDKVYKNVIPRNVKLSEAPSYGMPITLYDSRSKGAKSYEKFTKEFLKINDEALKSARHMR